MRICLIVNENAGSANRKESLSEAVEASSDVTCWKSTQKGDGTDLATKAAKEGFDVVAAAGGDGTINEVANGLMAAATDVALGIVPLGTGNDLARTLDIPIDPHDAIALLRGGERRRLDLFLVEYPDGTVYGINAATGGLSGEVGEVVTSELKEDWGPLAYLIGAASFVPDIPEYETYVSYDGAEPEMVHALNIIVANGRTVAGGKRVSPLSNPEDGLLNAVIVKKGTVVELGDVAARLVAGNLLGSPIVTHRTVRSLRIDSRPGMSLSVDGEVITNEPVTISVREAALNVVVGAKYHPEIEP